MRVLLVYSQIICTMLVEKKLSVIIVSYGVNDKLLACLDSLDNSDNDDFFEVVVIDNFPEDVACVSLKDKYPDFVFIKNVVNGGFGNGCNYGAQRAKGELVVFLNPDTVVSIDALKALVDAACKHPEWQIVSCRQVTTEGKESVAMSEFPSLSNITGLLRSVKYLIVGRKRFPSTNNGDVVFPDWVSGSLMLVRRADFVDMGGFDDDFWMYYEDVDLCRRVSDNGGVVAFLAKPCIIHNHGGTTRQSTKTALLTKCEVKISRHLYVAKHFSGHELFLTQIFLVLNNVCETIVILLPGLLLFMCKPVHLHMAVQLRLMAFYLSAVVAGSWISPRSVNAVERCRHKWW